MIIADNMMKMFVVMMLVKLVFLCVLTEVVNSCIKSAASAESSHLGIFIIIIIITAVVPGDCRNNQRQPFIYAC